MLSHANPDGLAAWNAAEILAKCDTLQINSHLHQAKFARKWLGRGALTPGSLWCVVSANLQPDACALSFVIQSLTARWGPPSIS